MTPDSKGRWVGAAVAVVITAAWASVFAAKLADTCASGVVELAGGLFGLPYGLVAGTAVGRYAGRRNERRGLVIAASLAWVLAADTLISAALSPLLDGTNWLLTPSVGPMALTLIALSLAIALPAAVWLERWTRAPERVPRATVRR